MSVILVLLPGCVNSTSEGELPTDSEKVPVHDEISNSDTESSIDFDVFMEQLALETAIMLGYDESLISIGDKELLDSSDRLLWSVQLNDSLETFATIIIDEGLKKVSSIRFRTSTDEMVPSAIESGEGLFSGIEEALELADQGYRPGWRENKENEIFEYRKYVAFDEWEICVGSIHIITNPELKKLSAIHWTDYEMPDSVSVQIDRDAAIETAISFRGNTDASPLHAELVLYQTGPSHITDIAVVWEIAFDDTTVNIRCDDGSIL